MVSGKVVAPRTAVFLKNWIKPTMNGSSKRAQQNAKNGVRTETACKKRTGGLNYPDLE
jgi:hypothetical protein